jgi:hypothetical protein
VSEGFLKSHDNLDQPALIATLEVLAVKVELAVIILTLSATLALGQTAKDIETKFGEPTNAYSVSEHIWMTPEYGADGQVCQMRFYPKRIGPNIDFLSTHLRFDQLTAILNRLVPPNIRGIKIQALA